MGLTNADQFDRDSPTTTGNQFGATMTKIQTIIANPTRRMDRRPHSTAEVATWNDQLQAADPHQVVEWAVQEFGSRLCLTASFADTLLIDIATKVEPDIEVVFIDTGFHFPETLETMRTAMARYSLRLRVLQPNHIAADLWVHGAETCCGSRKIAPLDRYLTSNADAWMSGLRRDDSARRASTPIVSLDSRGLVKINPLAAWPTELLDEYVITNDVLINQLAFEGYPSIGCWPCTMPSTGSDKRSGRWAGTAKTECGIH